MSYLKQRQSAFGYAFSGLIQSFKTEAHLKIHLCSAILVTGFGFYVGLNKWEWIALSGCIVLVISLEMINSAIERLCNLVMPQQHPGIKYIKDVCAAAVLVAGILAVLVGSLIFWPYIKLWFN